MRFSELVAVLVGVVFAAAMISLGGAARLMAEDVIRSNTDQREVRADENRGLAAEAPHQDGSDPGVSDPNTVNPEFQEYLLYLLESLTSYDADTPRRLTFWATERGLRKESYNLQPRTNETVESATSKTGATERRTNDLQLLAGAPEVNTESKREKRQSTRRPANAKVKTSAEDRIGVNSTLPLAQSGSGVFRSTASASSLLSRNPSSLLGRGLSEASEAIHEKLGGIRLEDVELFQAYYSTGLAGVSQNQSINPIAQQLRGDYAYGGATTLAWRRIRARSNLSTTYRPEFVGRANISEWTTLNHDLNFRASRSVSKRVEMSFDAATGVKGIEQFLIFPAVYSVVANPPGTLEDLIEAVRTGALTQDQAASLITGAPYLEHPEAVRLENRKVFRSSARTSFAFSPSARLTFQGGVGASTIRGFDEFKPTRPTLRLTALDNSEQIFADGGTSYQASRRTAWGIQGSARQQRSTITDSTYTTVTGSWERSIGRRWGISAQAGVGSSKLRNPAIANFDGESPEGQYQSTWVVGSSINYAGRAHRLNATANRSVGDEFGLGSRTNKSFQAGWTWVLPGSPWGVFASAGYIHADTPALAFDTRGARIAAGCVRRLSGDTAVRFEYQYFYENSPVRGLINNFSSQQLRLSWIWRATELAR